MVKALWVAALAALLGACVDNPNCDPPLGATTLSVELWTGERGTSTEGHSLWCPHEACLGLGPGDVVEVVPAPGPLAVVTRVVVEL